MCLQCVCACTRVYQGLEVSVYPHSGAFSFWQTARNQELRDFYRHAKSPEPEDQLSQQDDSALREGSTAHF